MLVKSSVLCARGGLPERFLPLMSYVPYILTANWCYVATWLAVIESSTVGTWLPCVYNERS